VSLNLFRTTLTASPVANLSTGKSNTTFIISAIALLPNRNPDSNATALFGDHGQVSNTVKRLKIDFKLI